MENKEINLNAKYGKTMTLLILSRIFGIITTLSGLAFLQFNEPLLIVGLISMCCFSLPAFILNFIAVIIFKKTSSYFNRAFYYIIAEFCLVPFLLAFFIAAMVIGGSNWAMVALNVVFAIFAILSVFQALAEVNGVRYLVVGNNLSSFAKGLYVVILVSSPLSVLFFILAATIPTSFSLLLGLEIAFEVVSSIVMLIIFAMSKKHLF